MISWFTPSFPRRFLFTTLSETSEFRAPTQIESSKLRELVSFWILIIGIEEKKFLKKTFSSFPPPFPICVGARNSERSEDSEKILKIGLFAPFSELVQGFPKCCFYVSERFGKLPVPLGNDFYTLFYHEWRSVVTNSKSNLTCNTRNYKVYK